MKTITGNTEAEIVEKRSKFISNLYYVETVEQAENKLKEIKKKYNDARHNCFAYRVCEKNTIVERASDDGEPSGTAGAPMLNLLSKSDLTNCLVIVTRYFGGILLGTGGLVRAYTESAKQAIEKAKSFNFDLNWAVMASDAFFPFPDCVEIADKAGITAVIQPGGSIKDELSVAYCNEHNIAMVKTGVRHFKH